MHKIVSTHKDCKEYLLGPVTLSAYSLFGGTVSKMNFFSSLSCCRNSGRRSSGLSDASCWSFSSSLIGRLRVKQSLLVNMSRIVSRIRFLLPTRLGSPLAGARAASRYCLAVIWWPCDRSSKEKSLTSHRNAGKNAFSERAVY